MNGMFGHFDLVLFKGGLRVAVPFPPRENLNVDSCCP